jgi:O-antigen/teichoic acid export membrane protein
MSPPAQDAPPAEGTAGTRALASATQAAERAGSGRLSQLFKHSATYSLVPLFGRVISIVMLYFFARWMPEGEMGLVDLADLVLASLVQVLGYNLLSGMTRFYFEHVSEADRRRVISSCTIALAALSWLVVLVLIYFRRELAPILIGEGTERYGSWVIQRVLFITLLVIPFQLTGQCGFYYLQIQQRSGVYAAIQMAKILFELGLRIYLVGFAGHGPAGYLYPILAGEILITLGLTTWVLSRTGLEFSWRVLRPIVAYTLPLIPVGLFQLALHYGDRRLLEHFASAESGLDQVGIYGVGYKIGFLATGALLGPFVQIFHPWIYGVSDRAEQAWKLARVSTYGILTIAAVSLCVTLASHHVLELMMPDDRSYILAWKVVPLITSGYVFWAVYHLSQIPLYIAKRTGPLVWINALALLLNVLANALLVPHLGFLGAGLATLLTFAALAGAGLTVSRRAMSVPFEFGRLVGILAIMGVAAVGGVGLDLWLEPKGTLALFLNGAAKLALGLGLLAGLYWGVLRAEERLQLTQAVRRRLGKA